jgi:large subunit ribosomal protein L5e
VTKKEGKTDYYARKRLVCQAKNKYNSPKYRLVVRITNKDIICQVMYSKIQGDVCLAAAYSHELPQYGIEFGLTNWSAAYATGLLCARRVLKKMGLDETYKGAEEVDGNYYQVEHAEEGPRPFKAYLDVGLRRTTTGSRIFGALKGAVDGGMAIPYSEARFPGYDKESKEADAELIRNYVYGIHVADYMEYLQEEDEETYKKQFARYVEAGIEPDALEDMYTEAHEKIRADPSPEKKPALSKADKEALKKHKPQPRNRKQRQNRVAQKIAAFERRMAMEA